MRLATFRGTSFAVNTDPTHARAPASLEDARCSVPGARDSERRAVEREALFHDRAAADAKVRVWEVPGPPPESAERVRLAVQSVDVDRIRRWVEAETGLALTTEGQARAFDKPVVQQFRRRLKDLGGPAFQPSASRAP
jgi:hypothetical protein